MPGFNLAEEQRYSGFGHKNNANYIDILAGASIHP